MAALLAFDHCEQVLKNEMGAKPSPETRALLATIEQADGSVVPTRRRVPASVLRPPRLIGRAQEWAALHHAWDQGHAVLVCGEAGMGKTRLVTDFALARGRTVLAGARPGDAQVAYASVSRLFRQLPRQGLDQLAPPLRKELARLLPELGEVCAIASPEERARFFNAVQAVLETPAFEIDGFVFDDLHFADDASVELLQYALAGSRQPWLVATRGAEVGSAGRMLLTAFTAQSQTASITLEPLTLEQVSALLSSLELAGIDPQVVAPELLRHTGGNPMYLLETMKAWWAKGSNPTQPGTDPASPTAPLSQHWPVADNVSALITRRIAQLSPHAVQLVRCAAIAGCDFSVELASHVLGLPTIALTDPYAELEAAQVLCDGAFVHDLIYESALASVPALVTQRLHAEIAGFLRSHAGEPVRLALHWAGALQWAQAGVAYQAAAELSRNASRWVEQTALLAEAAQCFERAGQPLERFNALLQRARMLSSNDLGTLAQEAIAQLDALACTDAQRLQVLDARLELSITRYEGEDALDLALRAVDSARTLGQHNLELRFAILASGALCDARQAAEAVALLAPYAGSALARADIEQQWEYWSATALALDYANRLCDAMPAWEQARDLAQHAGRQDMAWKTMSNAASTQAKMGLVARAAHTGVSARRLALDVGDGVTLRVLQMQVTVAHRLRDAGRYAEALNLLEEAQLGYETLGGSNSDKAQVEQRLVVLYQQLGQPARAVPLLATPRLDVPKGVAMIRLAHFAELEHCMGRDGLVMMREALQIIANPDDIYQRITSLFATRLVPADEGEAMATSLATWASGRERYGVALAGHVRAAACALAQGSPARALPHAETALQLARTYQPDSFYLPEAWLVAAQALQALGRRADGLRAASDGLAWVRAVHDKYVPLGFRDSFLNRNPVNCALLALVADAAISPAAGVLTLE